MMRAVTSGAPHSFSRPVVRVWLTLLCSILITASAFAAGPGQLQPAVQVQDHGVALCPGNAGSGYAIPCVTDWNGDGKQDLLVGYQSAGKIALYLNQGTRDAPCFTNFSNLRVGSAEISYPSGGCGAPAPWVCDFDGDGDRDLLVGAGADGTVWLHRNTNTDGAPMLDRGVQVKVGAANLSVGLRATPMTCDWDRDGLVDLLCGAGDGYAYFFKNTNTAAQPVYAPAVKLRAGTTDLNVGIRSVLRVFDWDADGTLDLVCSSDSGVYWCRGTVNGLAAKESLCAPSPDGRLIPINTGGRMRLDLADWNNDGVIDLLLGNLNGTVSLFEGYRFRCESISLQANTIRLIWQSAPYLTYRILGGSSPNSMTNLISSHVLSEGRTTIWNGNADQPAYFYTIQVE